MGMLRVQLLGGLNLQVDDEPVPPIASRVGRSLFAYLICNQRAHPREELAARFWPDLPESRARRRLSHTLWQIQDPFSELEDASYIEATADTLAFNADAPYWLDVEEFEERLQQVDASGEDVLAEERSLDSLRRCVELYHGDFLSGYYDDWVLAEQERLRQRYIRALRRLAHATKARGHYEEALTYARRITNQDGLDESAHREVMRLCILVGRPSDALRQYERCRSVLAEELGAEPAASTVELYERIARQRQAVVAPATTPESAFETPFVGRETERRAIVDALERGLAGRGSVVFIEGEPGVGKTRLADHAAEDARWRGMLVLRSACHDRVSPYEPLAEAFEGALTPLRVEQLRQRLDEVWLHEVARAIPRLRRALGGSRPARLTGREASERTREGFLRSFLELANGVPTVVILEDAHWVDDESLDVIGGLARRAREVPLVIVLTYRANEARGRLETWQALRTLDRATRPLRLVLGSLEAAETAELARRVFDSGPPSAEFLRRIHAETGGNPLFVVETLRVLRDRGTAALLDADLPLPASIRAVVAERTASLLPQSHELLTVAAVQAVDIDLATLRRAAQMSREDVLAALDELLRRGLLEERNDEYAFGHEQVRRAVEDDLSPTRRRLLHRRVAEALEESKPAEVEGLAQHYLAADLPARALRYVVASARRAERLHAYESAGRRYAQAAELLDRVPLAIDERFGILAAYEQVLDVLARRDEQAHVLESLRELAGGDRERRCEVERRSVLLLANTDRFAEAEAAVQRALALADTSHRRASVLTAAGTAMRWAGKVTEATRYLEEAIAEPGIDGQTRADTALALGRAAWEARRYHDARRHLDEADRAFESIGDLRGRAEVLASLAAMQMETGEGRDAERTYRRAIEVNTTLGARQSVARDLVNLGNVLWFLGFPARAIAAQEEAASIFRELGHRRGEAMARMNGAEVRLLMTGDVRGAFDDAGSARRYFASIGDDRWEGFALATLADANRRCGDLDRAAQIHRAASLRADRAGDPWITVEVFLKRAQFERDIGATDVARGLLEDALDLCAEHGFADRAVVVRVALTHVLVDLGAVEQALAMSETAMHGSNESVERGYLVHFARSVALQAAGSDEEAREALETAHSHLRRTVDDLEPSARHRALTEVAEHRQLVDAWQSHRPTCRSMSMATVDAPVGRPLRDDELVEVTVELPNELPTEVRARRTLLSSVLSQAWGQGAAPTHEDLATLLGVSSTTIRRDLRALETQGLRPVTRGSRAS